LKFEYYNYYLVIVDGEAYRTSSNQQKHLSGGVLGNPITIQEKKATPTPPSISVTINTKSSPFSKAK
jgi:hypothetical protein